MDESIARKIIVDAALIGVHSLKFNWRGESTLHPKFEAVTSLAKKLAHGSTFIDRISNTNMKFYKNNESIIRGLCNQTKVKISLDSLDKEVLEKQRSGADYENIISNIDALYSHPHRDNKIVIQAVRTKLNEWEDLEYDMKKRWPGVDVSIREMVSGRIEGAEKLETKQRDFSDRKPCLQAFNRLVFSSSGDAMPCCVNITEQLSMGNIKNHTIKEIFNSDKAKAIRTKLQNKTLFKYEPCASCSSFESFAGFEANWDS
jgi:radical SAM protein with 4Fe4S-binding SPASM domain